MSGKHESLTRGGNIIRSPRTRDYLYKVLAAAGPVVMFYGLMSAEEIIVWLGFGGTVLGTPAGVLASANTPKAGS